ncbi:MAG: hypothetical protein HYV93_26390 [Candidatus Rokubacteria bacterium]|nr:hypothetical protein [Candidatus Rokubacteria bacterium]
MILTILLWSGAICFGCWFLAELMDVVMQGRKDRAMRRRPGMGARPGESAYEERMRLYAAQLEEGGAPGAHQ